MARASTSSTGVLLCSLVAVLAVAFVQQTVAQNSVTPVAQCWETRQEASNGSAPQTVYTLYYGYNNAFSTPQSIAVSMSNYFNTPPEVSQVPISQFAPGLHGLAMAVDIFQSQSLNNTVTLQWNLNGTVASLNDGNAAIACNAQPIGVSYQLVSSQAPNQTNYAQMASIIAQTAGLDVSFVQVITDNINVDQVDINILPGGAVTPFQAGFNMYNAYYAVNSSLVQQLTALLGSPILAFSGAATPYDAPGTAPAPQVPVTPPPQAPIIPQITPIAQCWEADTASSNYWVYFGYASSYPTTETIEPAVLNNQFVNVPPEYSPFPVFYPGYNGFVSRVLVTPGTIVQWLLAGNQATLDTSTNATMCPDSGNVNGLKSVAVWSNGNINVSDTTNGVDAISAVSGLPIDHIMASWTEFNSGIRATFTLYGGNGVSVYRAMYRTVADFHLVNSTLRMLWSEAFGTAPANYTAFGTTADQVGVPAAVTPVSNCWIPGNTASEVVAFFGYSSNYLMTSSYSQGMNNYILNANVWDTPNIMYSGYSGFASSAIVSNNASLSSYKVSWNLAGNTVSLDISNQSLQCPPNQPTSLYVVFTNGNFSTLNQIAAANGIANVVNQATGISNALVTFQASSNGFTALITLTPPAPFAQYLATTSFLLQANALSNTLRVALNAATNATVVAAVGGGSPNDVIGAPGSAVVPPTLPSQGTVTVYPVCWNSNGQGITGYFGYNSTGVVYATSQVSSIPTGPLGVTIPTVFNQVFAPYAARIDAPQSSSISWTVGVTTASVSLSQLLPCPIQSASVVLTFQARLSSPPSETLLLQYVSAITGYPLSNITSSWDFSTATVYSLTVNFVANSNFGTSSASAVTNMPISAAILLSRDATDNVRIAATIGNLVGSVLYSAKPKDYVAPAPPVSQPPVPVAPMPIAPPTGGVPPVSPPVAPPTQAPTPVAVQPPVAPPTQAPISPAPVTPVAPIAPVAPAPITINPAPAPTGGAPVVPPPSGLSGVTVFGIIIGIILAVGILGGVGFFIFKYHKSICGRKDAERRPLLED